jgi:hypothetical protein
MVLVVVLTMTAISRECSVAFHNCACCRCNVTSINSDVGNIIFIVGCSFLSSASAVNRARVNVPARFAGQRTMDMSSEMLSTSCDCAWLRMFPWPFLLRQSLIHLDSCHQ